MDTILNTKYTQMHIQQKYQFRFSGVLSLRTLKDIPKINWDSHVKEDFEHS